MNSVKFDNLFEKSDRENHVYRREQIVFNYIKCVNIFLKKIHINIFNRNIRILELKINFCLNYRKLCYTTLLENVL